MQPQLRFIQQNHVGHHFIRQVEQRHQCEEAKRAVRCQMRAIRLVVAARPPAQRDLAVLFDELEAIEPRQDSGDLSADQIVAAGILALQPQQHRRKVAAVRAKLAAVVDIPQLLEARVVRCVVELVHGAAAQKVPDRTCCDLVCFRVGTLRRIDEPRFVVCAAQQLPFCFRWEIRSGKPERLIGEDQPIRLRPDE